MCLIIGDTNLDKEKWNAPEQIHIHMVDLVKEEIKTLNYCQIIEGITRSWPGQESSLIDQCWTTHPQ